MKLPYLLLKTNFLKNMCKNNRIVTNPYTGRFVLAPCRVCPDCLQEKANRFTMRIRLFQQYQSIGLVPYFILLHYDNLHVPYIDNKSSVECNYINVYRGYGKNIKHLKPLCNCKQTDKVIDDINGFNNLRRHPYTRHVTGILYYRDIQNFMKRFRIRLKRDYGITSKVHFFAAGEYGGETKRPHWHLLLFVPKEVLYKQVYKTLLKTWKMCDFRRGPKRPFELARDVSKYIASYVNEFTQLPSYLQHKKFRPKVRFSINFGNHIGVTPRIEKFLFDEIIHKNNFRYLFNYTSQVNIVQYPILVPLQVQNRYFPNIKGKRFLSFSAIHELLRNINLSSSKRTLDYLFPRFSSLGFTSDEFRYFVRRVLQVQALWDLSPSQYADLYLDYFKGQFLSNMREQYMFYSINNFMMSLRPRDQPVDYNDNNVVNTKHSYLFTKFTEFFKHRQTNNIIYG